MLFAMVKRVCEYFKRYGIQSDELGMTEKLWRKHGYQVSSEVPLFLLHHDEDDEDIGE